MTIAESTSIQVQEEASSAAGARVLTVAQRHIGTVENPVLSNRGTKIDAWATRWGTPLASPWCALFADAVYSEARVSDDGIGYPSVAGMYARARGQNAAKKNLISLIPYPGCFVLFVYLLADGKTLDTSQPVAGGAHVELFVRWHNKAAGVAVTIGGNTPITGASPANDGVVYHLTSIGRPRPQLPAMTTVFAVPRALHG